MDEAVRLRFLLEQSREREQALSQKRAGLEGTVLSLRRQLADRDKQYEQALQVILRLEQRVRDLEMRVRQDSQSSHQPPSSDNPFTREARRRARNERKAREGKKRGAKKGHRGTRRALVERPDEVHSYEPHRCEGCGHSVGSSVPQLCRRTQVWELPPMRAEVTEHRQYGQYCRRCGRQTVAKLPEAVRAHGAFGPRLRSTLGLLTGAYRVSRRQAQGLMKELFGLEMSLGAVSENEARLSGSLQGAYKESGAFVGRSRHLHVDETPFAQRGKLQWMWASSNERCSHYRIEQKRNSETAHRVLGGFTGLLTTDRLGSYNVYDSGKRQYCWAHLLRDFKALKQHDPEAKVLATEAVDAIERMLQGWGRIRDGTDPYEQRRTLMAPHQHTLDALFEKGKTCSSRRVRGLCARLQRQHGCLWRFVLYGTEPTNNQAERALKPAVIWRKTSFGTQSERGNRFVERMLTVTETLKAQKRSVLAFMHTTLERHALGQPLPLLAPGA